MKLIKLTQNSISDMKHKSLCCIELSSSYLDELCAKYPVLDRLSLILDDRSSKQGKFVLNGKELPVRGYEALAELDLSGWAFIITGDYYRELYASLEANEHVADKVDTVYYFANTETEYEEEFREKYKGSTLENIIIFRSGPHITSYMKGMDFTDNARALFEYMLENKFNEKYELVWLVKNPEEFTEYSKYANVKFLPLEWSVSSKEEERAQYYRVLCLAKYIFFTDAYGIARNSREDQIRVQLWHGCGFKTRLNFSPCEKRYEYMTVTSELYADIHSKVFGLRPDQLLVTGSAKGDWLFQKPAVPLELRLGYPLAKQYIYWLPTYRMAAETLVQTNGYEVNPETGFPIVDTMDKMRQLNELLSRNGQVLVIKLHPYQNLDKIQKLDFSNIVLLDNARLFAEDIQINQLLGGADALISDYSSVAVDYLALDRPMAFMLEDVKAYEESRGFVFDNVREWLPGQELYSFEEVCTFVSTLATGTDPAARKREKLRKLMNAFCDGDNCRRITEALGITKE